MCESWEGARFGGTERRRDGVMREVRWVCRLGSLCIGVSPSSDTRRVGGLDASALVRCVEASMRRGLYTECSEGKYLPL